MKKFIAFIVMVWAMVFVAGPAFAENFYIKNYDVSMTVSKDKSVDIIEDLDVVFTTSSHGIYRDIPFLDASITDIDVSERWQTSYGGDSVSIKIGDPDVLVMGPHHYWIRYKYNYFDNKNEFYHNIIGNGWSVDIKNAKFSVKMPEPVDPSKVGLSIGTYGTKGFKGGAEFFVKDNLIYGQTHRVLGPGEGITLRVEVPDGYFNKYVNHTKGVVALMILLFTIAAFLTWLNFGKDEQIVPVVNFYPPKGLNSAEAELCYKGKASTKGLVALLVELAKKGYINIENDGHKWTLHRTHGYDGVNKDEKALLTALFPHGKNSVERDYLETSQSFYKDCQRIVENINKKRDQIFNAESIGFKLQAFMFVCLIGILAGTVFALFDLQWFTLANEFPLLLFSVIAVCALIGGLKNPQEGCFLILWALMFGGFSLVMLLSMHLRLSNLPLVLFGLVCLIIAGVCTYQLPKRNKTGVRILGELEGLKKFIEVAEEHRLKQLVEQNPEYFYDVLPYAYIFGLSDKWIDRFEGIMEFKPDWYNGETFSGHNFGSFVNSLHSVSVPSVANGGISTSSSSGGGGFSGGGGGGGGGGSW
ncbi:DUF2207 domain-containing protein [bacterium]|nr:DUF2207 domain-containing protein [bacterium]